MRPDLFDSRRCADAEVRRRAVDIAAAVKEVSLSNKLNRYMSGEELEADPKKATLGRHSRESKDGDQVRDLFLFITTPQTDARST